ncbi:MAG: hypothetical protein NHB32_09380 [Fischerella sp. CENA71]|nr:hypothetical protein [Fischerella sp. CENA71]
MQGLSEMISYLSQGKIKTNIGVLVVDNQRRIVSLNRKFIEIWQIPRYIIDTRDEDFALEFVSKYFEEPKVFLKEVKNFNKQTHIEISDTIKFKDGRMLKRYSQPQWLDKQYVGRLWMWHELGSVISLNKLTLISNQIL